MKNKNSFFNDCGGAVKKTPPLLFYQFMKNKNSFFNDCGGAVKKTPPLLFYQLWNASTS